jgi:hypothetical protein
MTVFSRSSKVRVGNLTQRVLLWGIQIWSQKPERRGRKKIWRIPLRSAVEWEITEMPGLRSSLQEMRLQVLQERHSYRVSALLPISSL